MLSANMERAQEYTQRRIGQLESSLHFRAETKEALHKKRAALTSSLHANDSHIKQLAKLRDAMDRECRALEEDVGVRALGSFVHVL
jgi:septal ring factor EnvC (AmiA/AmiB activator)